MLSEDNKKHIQKLKSDYNQHPKKTSINRAFIKVIKDNQEPDDEYLTYDSGDKTWTYFTEHGFQESLKPREGISHDAFSKAQQSFLVDRKFEEVFELTTCRQNKSILISSKFQFLDLNKDDPLQIKVRSP